MDVKISSQTLADIDARIADLDRFNIDVQVVFPTMFLAAAAEDVKLEGSYDYNIFEVLEAYLKNREVPSGFSARVSTKFKEIHDNIKNTKNYYE